MRARGLLTLALVALTLAACTTTYGEGRKALGQGRYTDAATRFEEVLAKHPDRVEALLGLGVAKYRAGRYDEALDPLGRALAREPKLTAARLYLGLAQLRRAEIGAVEEHFKALVAERPGTRLAAQAQRILQLLRGPDAASDDLRTFMAASLENESESERDVAEARRQARDAELRWRDAYPYYAHPLALRSRCRC
jgi:tetratricopeptide (TPR) repeat protein